MSTTNHVRHAQQRLRRIAAEWPADPLRPKIQLKTFLAALAEHPVLSPRAVAATNALHQNQVASHVSGLSSDSTALTHNVELFFQGPYSANGVEARFNAVALCPA